MTQKLLECVCAAFFVVECIACLNRRLKSFWSSETLHLSKVSKSTFVSEGQKIEDFLNYL